MLAEPLPAQPVRPILGALARCAGTFDLALGLVAERWGAPDLASPAMAFEFTDYYAAQMGPDLQRRFWSFPIDMDPAELAEVKLWTNALERRVAESVDDPFPRPVNLDPGYINDGKLVLATVKDHAHRVYLGAGVYAEVTLHYESGAWQDHAWIYPDFRTEAYKAFFDQARALYLGRARNARRPDAANRAK